MNETSLPRLPLGPGGRSTSKLGFGCSGISGGLAKRASLALLQAAYDAGIRHFDVAPMYGFGTAEAVLGEFALRHAGSVTIATKYGIPPPASGAALAALRSLVRPLANRVPAVRRALIHKAGQVAHTSVKTSFSPEGALRSLEASLRNLRVERLDLFLLHEATLEDLRDARLLRMLQDARQAGKIAQFGVASPWHAVETILRTRPDYCPVVQHEWTVFAAPVSGTAFHVCHRTIVGALDLLHPWLQTNPSRQQAWSEHVGMDLSQRDTLAHLLLNLSCARTPGLVLFSSRQQQRIEANVRSCVDAATSNAAQRLFLLVEENFPGSVHDADRASPSVELGIV